MARERSLELFGLDLTELTVEQTVTVPKISDEENAQLHNSDDRPRLGTVALQGIEMIAISSLSAVLTKEPGGV